MKSIPEPGNLKDLRCLWPPTHKANSGDAGTQTYLQTYGHLNRHEIKTRKAKALPGLWQSKSRSRKSPNIITNLWTPKND